VIVWTEVDRGYVKVVSDVWAFKKRRKLRRALFFSVPPVISILLKVISVP